MTEYTVEVERDSVCMGDDIDAPHPYSFRVPSDSTLNEVFEHLGRKHYLASVAGRNHSWEAIIEDNPVALFKGNNRLPEPEALLSKKLSAYTTGGTLNIRFKYNSAAS